MKHGLRLALVGLLGLVFSIGLHLLPVPYSDRPVQAQARPSVLLQTAKERYDLGQFSEAAQLLHNAGGLYADQGDSLRQAQTLGLMSLTLQQLGQWDEAQEAIAQSLSLLDVEESPVQEVARIRAQVINAQAHLHLTMGQAEAALTYWKLAEQLYVETSTLDGIIGSQINQTRALQSLGFYRQANQLLGDIEDDILNQPDSTLKLKGMLRLGNLLRLEGQLVRSRDILMTAMDVAQNFQSPHNISEILLSLGTTERVLAKQAESEKNNEAAQQHLDKALLYYQEAAAIAPVTILQSQAQLNQLSLLVEVNRLDNAHELIPQITPLLPTLPVSRNSVYAYVNFAKSLLTMKATDATLVSSEPIAQVLDIAIQQANHLTDSRALSYAAGTFAALYEQDQNWVDAKAYTQWALTIAQGINASDISYQWQWQMGRILQAEHETTTLRTNARDEALHYYSTAIQTLDRLRSDLVALNPDLRFSFQENIEPVYRQFVDLLLRPSTETLPTGETISSSSQLTQDNLIRARDVIEALQLAELDNFFRDACAQPQITNIDTIDASAAIVYPIILGDRLEVIVRLPGSGHLLHHSHSGISEHQIDRATSTLSRALQRIVTSRSELMEASRDIYGWLIRPFASELELTNDYDQSAIKTLVFVLDGSFRNLPMAALYDGNQYLVERYAIAVAPGLQLVDPKAIKRDALSVLLAGITDGPSFINESFSPLDNVSRELEQIATVVPNSTILSNQDFLKEIVQDKINSAEYNAVHIATHGIFSSNLEQTFILDWQERIQAEDMDNLLWINDPEQAQEHPIELLTLSACETAAGDKRATLGLAGLSIRAGVRSTLATLWQVDDASIAELMILFYQQLNDPENTKAEALRNVQLSFLKNPSDADYKRPYYWAPFILIGSWL